MKYIHELKNWPQFQWDREKIANQLTTVRYRQGVLLGRMEALGFPLRTEAVLQSLTEEILKSHEIEGEHLDRDQVRSSIARHLGVDIGGLIPSDRHVEGVVEIMLDATQNFTMPLSTERLFKWHSALFPTARRGMSPIQVGKWRDDRHGPMQVVSGSLGRERVHFEAPAANRLNQEMKNFLKWINQPLGPQASTDPVLKAGIAHLWFLTLHPFDDGNGRIARVIADMLLARSENTSQRFYSMSAQICAERKDYYSILETTQSGTLEITPWLSWFIECLDRAFNRSELILSSVLKKAQFWEQYRTEPLNDRQRKIVNLLLDGFEGKLTSSKWAILGKCSQDTAIRDIDDLMNRGILKKNSAGGRSTSYSLAQFH